jgi:hypothetical protein
MLLSLRRSSLMGVTPAFGNQQVPRSRFILDGASARDSVGAAAVARVARATYVALLP